MNKFFYWPCLLFSKEKSSWTSAEFDDLQNLHKAEKGHENTVAHILSLKDFNFLERIR
jgi:hypothetical protein